MNADAGETPFRLVSEFEPKGDQPSAIVALVDYVRVGVRFAAKHELTERKLRHDEHNTVRSD